MDIYMISLIKLKKRANCSNNRAKQARDMIASFLQETKETGWKIVISLINTFNIGCNCDYAHLLILFCYNWFLLGC